MACPCTAVHLHIVKRRGRSTSKRHSSYLRERARARALIELTALLISPGTFPRSARERMRDQNFSSFFSPSFPFCCLSFGLHFLRREWRNRLNISEHSRTPSRYFLLISIPPSPIFSSSPSSPPTRTRGTGKLRVPTWNNNRRHSTSYAKRFFGGEERPFGFSINGHLAKGMVANGCPLPPPSFPTRCQFPFVRPCALAKNFARIKHRPRVSYQAGICVHTHVNSSEINDSLTPAVVSSSPTPPPLHRYQALVRTNTRDRERKTHFVTRIAANESPAIISATQHDRLHIVS